MIRVAMCENKGLVIYTAKVSNGNGGWFVDQKRVETPAPGHKWDEGTVTKEPTCTEKGEKTYKCKICGKTKTEEIDALGHTTSTEWKSDSTSHWQECTVCGEKLNVSAHTFGEWKHTGSHTRVCTVCGYSETEECIFGDWTVTKAPTASQTGLKTRKCVKCGYEETEEIPAIGTSADPTNGKGGKGGNAAGALSAKKTSKAPRTGDSTDSAVLYLMMAIAASCLGGFAVRKKSEER